MSSLTPAMSSPITPTPNCAIPSFGCLPRRSVPAKRVFHAVAHRLFLNHDQRLSSRKMSAGIAQGVLDTCPSEITGPSDQCTTPARRTRSERIAFMRDGATRTKMAQGGAARTITCQPLCFASHAKGPVSSRCFDRQLAAQISPLHYSLREG